MSESEPNSEIDNQGQDGQLNGYHHQDATRITQDRKERHHDDECRRGPPCTMSDLPKVGHQPVVGRMLIVLHGHRLAPPTEPVKGSPMRRREALRGRLAR